MDGKAKKERQRRKIKRQAIGTETVAPVKVLLET